MHAQNAVLLGLLLATMLAAGFDLRSGRLPNQLLLAGVIAMLLLRVGYPLLLGNVAAAGAALCSSILGVAAAGLAPLLLWRLGGLGGGDVKLLCWLGASAGPTWGLEAEFYAFAFVTVYACARLAFAGRLLLTLLGSTLLLANPLLKRERRFTLPGGAVQSLRFAPAICAGSALMAFLHWRVTP
jgi:prepilin peptidase CpaA